ncbi:HlyD family efflux transporter periplasmic adaptor subunit [Nordella sp. HKS 07]|uniref:HlyD family secretion protein n=1 Tax=Nordella sp. HKS 07 TaxID=2712222 RepID=UPI0013E1E223|nr:HlyD family efflux transporter periplasmic adaptor subunit [Nordella sp. HKS 07]QIG47171.1 HlyD family efflux transporter periplasmic adaptor subunit [Nordella sp. HKS 07]
MRILPILIVVVLVAGAAGGYAYWLQAQSSRVPAGLARANGRVEVERVDVATKYAGRIAELHVNEGDAVQKEEVLARLDTTEILAQLAAARAAVHRAHQGTARAEADVALREADLTLAEIELRRAARLAGINAGTLAELDRRTAQRDISKASLSSAKAAVEDAKAATEAAEAQVTQIEAVITDMTLKAPVSGRVEYRLAQSGEVVGVGERVLTLLNLSDVHMTIFLPTGQAGRVELGSDARIVLDSAPEYVVPATVTFVAAEAQFTPKYVETANEREKLMYRIKLHIDPEILQKYSGYVKAGMTGNAYVKIQGKATWPADLAPRLPDVP